MVYPHRMEVIPFVNGNYSRYAGLEVNLRLRGDFHGKESFTNPLFSHFPVKGKGDGSIFDLSNLFGLFALFHHYVYSVCLVPVR